MSFKTTYILFGLLIALLCVFLVTQISGTRKTEDLAYILPSVHDPITPVKTDDIESVEIKRSKPNAETLHFFKNAQGNWMLKEPSVRVDSTQIDRVITQVLNAKREEQADVTTDLAKFGLDQPSEVVTLFKKGSDKEWQVNVGETGVGGDKALVYVTTSDDPKQPLAVHKTDLDMLFKNVVDFRSKTLLADSAFDIQSVDVQQPKKTEVALAKTSEGRWRFDKPALGPADYDGEPAPTGQPATAPHPITGVRDLLQAVADLRVESEGDFGPTNDSDADLASKNLEKGNEQLRIQVKRQPSSFGSEEKKEPVTDALLIGKKADDKGEKLYARLESERNVVKIPAKKVEPITKAIDNPSAMRNRDLTDVETTLVDAIDLNPDGRSLVKLRKEGQPGTWKLFEAGKPQDADSTNVQGLLTALTKKREVKEFPTKSDAELGLDKPAAVISLWSEGLKKPEKKEEAKDEKKDAPKKDEKPVAEPELKDQRPTVKLVFGKKDKDVVYVRRETAGDTTRLGVPANLLEKVTEGKLAYLSHKLPSFASELDVTRLTLTRGNQTVELERAKDAKGVSTWKFKQPKELAGQAASATKVERILGDLRDLQVQKPIAEKAGDAELTRFGLKAPADKVVITTTKDKKTEDFVYLFGKESDDKQGVYAKVGKGDLVFTVRPDILQALQTNLRDASVFTFKADKVKALKLVGWQDVVGNPFTLELQRQSAQSWVAKVPAGYAVDSGRVDSFLSGFTAMRSERSMTEKPKPEYKLDAKEGALDIVLTVDGEKAPITLVVGAPAGLDGYYGLTNKQPGEVLVLPRSTFDQVRSRPAYLRKD
jgi:Domain of unknown function (DUF4340)